MKQLIASDYDGTLNRGGTVQKSELKAIEAWRNAQNIFGIVTGRSICSILPETEKFNIPYDFLCCNNGSEIYGYENKLLYRFPSDVSVLEPLCRFIAESGGLHAAISYNFKRYCLEFDHHSEAASDPNNIPIKYNHLKDIEYFTQVDTHFKNHISASEFAGKVNYMFSDKITAYPNGINVDIVPKGAGKAQGIYKLCELTSIDPADVITVGDNYNDLSMLKEFKGYAVKTAVSEVLEKSENICEDIAEIVHIHCL